MRYKEKSFKVFDATLYRFSKPDNLPMRPINAVYSGRLWENTEDRSKLPSRKKVHDIAVALPQNRVTFIDIEHWPLWSEENGTYREYLCTIIQWMKEANPSLQIGCYGMAPRANYNHAIGPMNTILYEKWLTECRMVSSIAETVDVLFPVLYTYVNDRVNWQKYAERNIFEAYRYNTSAKIYAFLWPQYHESLPVLGLSYIPSDQWLEQLQICRTLCDGVVIWGGYLQTWDDEAPWWVKTKEFINTHATAF